MRISSKPTRANGITLLETIVYMACLTIIFSLCTTMFFKVMNQSRKLTKTINGVEKLLFVGEKWRSEIRAATQPVVLTQAPDRQSLRIVSGSSKINYILERGNLFREEMGNTSSPTLVYSNIHTGSFSSQQFSNVTAWSWRVEIEDESSHFGKNPVLHFLAIPGKTSR